MLSDPRAVATFQLQQQQNLRLNASHIIVVFIDILAAGSVLRRTRGSQHGGRRAQVDSANTNTTYGGVRERHELRGEPYNNISLIRLTQSISTSQWVTSSLRASAPPVVQVTRPE